MNFNSQEELNECVVKWQTILRLQDWKIIAHLSRSKDFPPDSEYGHACVRTHRYHHLAEIWILNHIDRDESSLIPEDHEVFLVHEMIHIPLHMMRSEPLEDQYAQMEEWAIISISESLVSLDRQKHGTS